MSSPTSLGSNASLTDPPKKLPPSKVPIGLAKGPNLKNVKSKVGSFNNVNHQPGGGEKRIDSQKLNWETKSRVGSFENATHKPKGGNVRVVTQKLEWNVKSKIGSLDNVKHVAGGGNVKIFDEKYTSNNGSQKSGCSTPSTTPRTPQPQQQQQIDQLLNDTQQKLRIN